MKIERRPKECSLQITTERHQRRRIPDGWRQTVPCTCRSHWKGTVAERMYRLGRYSMTSIAHQVTQHSSCPSPIWKPVCINDDVERLPHCRRRQRKQTPQCVAVGMHSWAMASFIAVLQRLSSCIRQRRSSGIAAVCHTDLLWRHL